MANKTYVAFVDKQGGTTASSYIGNEGELFYDPTTTTLRVSDGSTPGGTLVSGGGGTTDQFARNHANAAFDNSNTKVTFNNTFALDANDSVTIAYTDGSTSESVFYAEQGLASITVIDSGTPGAKLEVNSTKVVINNGQGTNLVDLEVRGNVIANSIVLSANNLLTGDESKILSIANSSGDGEGYTTLRLIPDDTVESLDQYLIIDPTDPGHIHIRAGGDQDNSNADLFLGGEISYFQVSAGQNPDVYISANNNIWTFYEYGLMKFPVKTWAEIYDAAEAGQKSFISDSDLEAIPANFGAIVGGGGANVAPVWSDGSNWRIG